MSSQIAAVELTKAYRLLNHGPTVLVSARHEGCVNVMAAAWACPLDFNPPKVTVVLDKSSKTRELIEQSGMFVVQVPTVAQLNLTQAVGTLSAYEVPDKLAQCGVEWQAIPGQDQPFVRGCSAWLLCRLLPEPHNQQQYDLFIGEVVGAWADTRVFAGGRWHFERAQPELRSIHHVAGGHFYATGEALSASSAVAVGQD